jgi:hypothetical protein
MKIEISVVNMPDTAAATVLGEIKTLVADYIAERGLRRMIKVKGGK